MLTQNTLSPPEQSSVNTHQYDLPAALRTSGLLRSVKDDLVRKPEGVYNVSCMCEVCAFDRLTGMFRSG